MRRLALAVMLVLVTVTAAASAAPGGAPLEFVTVVDNRIWSEDPSESEEVARLSADAGFNSVRIFVPYSLGQAEIINDARRLCNAAMAARNHGLKLIISIMGVKGYVPQGRAHVDRFIKTLNDHLYHLFGENGCTPDVKEFFIEIMNEPNDKTFWSNQTDADGNWIAPERYVRILSRVYPALKAKGAQLGVEVTVIAGALASKHRPLEFIRLMGEEVRSLDSATPLFDIFSHHPYPDDSNESPDTVHPGGNIVGMADYDLLAGALKSAFGFIPPIFYTEAGWESQVGKDQRQYWGQSPGTVQPVSERQQGEYYSLALQMAVQQPKVIGFAGFLLFDEPDLGRWQSGLYHADDGDPATPPSPKQSLVIVREAARRASGNF